jgi:DMSO/TMAO reductase YedYZ molybdopterin-dependent catalytic subunit
VSQRSCRAGFLLLAPLASVLIAASAVYAVAPLPQRGPYAPTVDLTGAVARPGTFDLARLQALPATRAEVMYITGNGPQTGIFVGPSLWDLLVDAGVGASGPPPDLLRQYVVATASDDYRVVLAMGDLLPDFGAQPVMVAYERDGQALGPEEGMARLVVPGDKRAGRNVFQLARLDVRTIDP